MSKAIKEEEKVVERIVPKYTWVESKEGEEEVTPIRRQIAKTMEITETFTYYDALAYVMKMEKAVQDKQAEIDGLETMIKAYRDEIEIIEAQLEVTKLEETFNLELHEKLKEEERLKAEEETMDKATELVNEIINEEAPE